MKKKNLIAYMISAISLILFMVILTLGVHSQNKKTQILSQKVSEIKLVEEEVAHNKRQIETLEKNYKSKLKEKATAQILFTSAQNKVYKEFFPKMKSIDMKGIIAVSSDNFIGDEGYINKAEFEEMIKSGWEYAVIWNGEGDFESFLKETKNKFSKAKIAMPPNIYFKAKTYSKKYNKTLGKYGFTTVMHHGEEKLPLVSEKFTKPLWFVGSASILSTSQSLNVASVINERGNIVYTVDFEVIKGQDYIAYAFDIIKNFREIEKQQPFLLTTINEARNIHGNLSDSDLKLSAEFRKKRKVYEDKIDELNDDIKVIYYGNNK